MNTTADEKIASAKQHIDEAIKDLSAVVIDKVWGTEDFQPSYLLFLRNVMIKLMGLFDRE